MSDKLQEHEGPKIERATHHETTKEKALKKKIDKLLSKAKKHRSKYDHRWLDYYKFFRGNQWPNSRPSYMHSEVFNFVFQTIQSQVPILMDRQPRIDYIPIEPNDAELAEIISNLAAYDWRRGNWNKVLIEMLYDAHIYGVANASLKARTVKGKGEISFESEDVFYCFPDPQAKDVNQDSSFFIVAKPIPVGKAKAKYKKPGIKADLVDLVGGDKTELGRARFQSPIDKKSAIEDSRESVDSMEEMALEITLYMKDDQLVEEKKKGKFIQRKKFPKGRKIVQVGGVIVEDKEYPYDDWEDRLAPYARLQNYALPREYYGISEVEQLEGPQKTFNKIVSFTLDVLTLMGNPVWIVDTASGVDTDDLDNRPGLIIEKERGSEVRRESGAQLQPYVLAMLDRVQGYFNEISGSTDVSRGVKPEGVSAAAAIRALQDASQTRLRLKGQLLDMFLQDVGQMYLSRVFQFYTAPQIFRITNNENVHRYFKMSVMPIETEDGIKEEFDVRVVELVPGEEGAAISGERTFRTQGKFDVASSIGSGLPFARAERATNAFQLFDRGIIDAEAVLDDTDYPNKDKVIARIAEKQAEQLALQAQQAPQGGQV